MYGNNDNQVILNFRDGTHRVAATTHSAEGAARAARLLQRARIANDHKRQYTKAARLIAAAEMIPGFKWNDTDLTA